MSSATVLLRCALRAGDVGKQIKNQPQVDQVLAQVIHWQLHSLDGSLIYKTHPRARTFNALMHICILAKRILLKKRKKTRHTKAHRKLVWWNLCRLFFNRIGFRLICQFSSGAFRSCASHTGVSVFMKRVFDSDRFSILSLCHRFCHIPLNLRIFAWTLFVHAFICKCSTKWAWRNVEAGNWVPVNYTGFCSETKSFQPRW